MASRPSLSLQRITPGRDVWPFIRHGTMEGSPRWTVPEYVPKTGLSAICRKRKQMPRIHPSCWKPRAAMEPTKAGTVLGLQEVRGSNPGGPASPSRGLASASSLRKVSFQAQSPPGIARRMPVWWPRLRPDALPAGSGPETDPVTRAIKAFKGARPGAVSGKEAALVISRAGDRSGRLPACRS
jgi:hypothetical protein